MCFRSNLLILIKLLMKYIALNAFIVFATKKFKKQDYFA